MTGRCVLLVEDDDDVRGAVEEILVGRGYRTLVAGDGATALAFLATHPIDVVVLDLTLPDMHGGDVLRARDGNPSTAGIPVIVASGVDGAPPIGPRDRLLRKPFAAEELLATVAHACSTPR